MVETPWGHASELKERKLSPGSGVPPAEVARNQLERLYAAAVAVVSEKGLEATTVADIIGLCGVSRSDFYKHFANKTQCLTAAAQSILEPTLRALADGQSRNGGRDPQATFEAFIRLVCSQPAAARVCLVELHAAGAEGEALADRSFEAVLALTNGAGGQASGSLAGQDLSGTVAAGIRKLIHTRLYRGEERELIDLAPELWRWMKSVVPPPRPLEAPRRQRVGGGPRFEGYTPAERIARAVARVVAEKGYGAMSTNDVAAEAAISLTTFYEHFEDKRDAVLAALEMSGAQITASAVPAARRAEGWQQGVRALYEGMCAYFAAEPEMAQLAMVGVYGAGPKALARRDRVIDSLSEMLGPGFAANPEAPSVSGEAIGATVYAMMR
jgi:AcrR family transcriptional regulator